MEYAVKRKKPLRHSKVLSPESYRICITRQPEMTFDQKLPVVILDERSYQSRAFLFLRDQIRQASASFRGLFGSFPAILLCGGRMPGNFPDGISFFGFPLRRSRFPDTSCIISHLNRRRSDSQRFGRAALGSLGSVPPRHGSFLAVRVNGWRLRAKSLVTKENFGCAGRFAVLGSRMRTRIRDLQQTAECPAAGIDVIVVPSFSRLNGMWQ